MRVKKRLENIFLFSFFSFLDFHFGFFSGWGGDNPRHTKIETAQK